MKLLLLVVGSGDRPIEAWKEADRKRDLEGVTVTDFETDFGVVKDGGIE
jgi:hypothetical protein